MTATDDLRVLVVEDEPIAAEAHTAYVSRVAGFVPVATVGTSQAALKALQDKRIDVVLLDMNLPDRHGLDVVRAMRAAGHRADVIAVTSARDLDVVRAAVSLGVVQYVLKPFVFATLRERGARIVKPPIETDWGGYSGYFADPDGHHWEVAWNPFWPVRPDGRIEFPKD